MPKLPINQKIPAKTRERFSDKLISVRKALNKTQKEFAEMVNLSKGYYERVERNSSNQLPASLIFTLCEKYGVNPLWLILDEGEMFRTGSSHAYDLQRSVRDLISIVSNVVEKETK